MFFIKKRLWHRRFSVNFVKFLKTPFSIEHLWWLLLFRLKKTFPFTSYGPAVPQTILTIFGYFFCSAVVFPDFGKITKYFLFPQNSKVFIFPNNIFLQFSRFKKVFSLYFNAPFFAKTVIGGPNLLTILSKA